MRLKLAKECLSLANKNCNLAVIQFNNQPMTRYEAAGQSLPAWTKNLRLFGEAGVVKIDKNGKLGDQGATCIFVNYSDQHAGDCFRMFNPKTNRIVETRDVQWLHKMYFRHDNIQSEFPEIHLNRNQEIIAENEVDLTKDDEETTDIDAIEGIKTNSNTESKAGEGEEWSDNDSDDESVKSTNTEASNSEDFIPVTRRGRAIIRPKWYQDGANETNLTATTYQNYYSIFGNNEEDTEIAAVGAAIGGGFDHTSKLIPMKFKEAMASPD